MRDIGFILVVLSVLFARGESPRVARLTAPLEIVPDTGGAFQHLVVHFDPRAEADVAPTYRDLFRAVQPTVRFSVLVHRAPHFTRFQALLRAWRIPRPERFEPVVVGRSITTWSRDRYTLLTQGRRRVLLVRARPHHAIAARQNDWYAPLALARALGASTRVEIAPLVFDGGDLIATDRFVFATALLLDRNRESPLGDPDRLRAWLREHTGRDVVLLGSRPQDVPPHHIGMFLTPLGRGTLLVGDPHAGLALLPSSAKLPLPVDLRPHTLRRFQRIAEAAKEAGFRVLPIPLVPLSDGVTYVTYNNAVLERRADGHLHAYVPQFGLPALDAAGRGAYERQGVVVHPIDVSRIYRHNGTVRCLVNVLRRSPL